MKLEILPIENTAGLFGCFSVSCRRSRKGFMNGKTTANQSILPDSMNGLIILEPVKF